MATPVLLLTLSIDGQVVRVATDAVDVTDAALSRVYPYSPGISDITVSSALSFLASSGPLSVPVEAILPVDVAALSAAGVVLDGSAAELALWTPGDDYGRRVVLAAATVTGAEWGEMGQPVRFSIARAESADAVQIPGSTELVDATTWPASIAAMPEADIGVHYPVVFGSPGAFDGSWITGSQGVWILNDNLFWQLAICAGPVVGDYVYLNSDGLPAGLPFRVTQQQDALGQLVSFVDAYADWPAQVLDVVNPPGPTRYYGLRNAAAVALQSTQATPVAVFVGWGTSTVDGSTPVGRSPLAGDVIVYVLGKAGARVDHGRFSAAARLLAGYRFDCVIDTPTKALEWLRTAIYPLLPLSIESGPAGDYPVVWRYDAPAVDATAAINADRDPAISRASAIKSDSSQIANAFALQYRYSVRTGSYTETVTRDATTCPYCAASERRWGRVERQVQTVVVYDSATAAAILAWMARAYTGVRRSVSYLVPSTYALTRGQVVTLTDSLVSLSAAVCLVSDVQVDGTGIDGVELLMIG